MLCMASRFIRMAREAWEREASRLLLQRLTTLLNSPTLRLSLANSKKKNSDKLIKAWTLQGKSDRNALLADGVGPGDVPVLGRREKRKAENPIDRDDE
jgi:hypothetical protein